MGFLSAAWSAYAAGRDYAGAWREAAAHYESGDDLPTIVRAFASETDGTIDDRAVETLVAGLRQLVETLDRGAGVAAVVAAAIEDAAPVWLDRVAVATAAVDRLARAAALRADRVAGTAAVVGSRLVAARVRLQALLDHPSELS